MDENSRFRRALKNPLVTVGLCLVAGISVYQNIIQSPPDTARPDFLDPVSLQTESAVAYSKPSISQEHDDPIALWIEHPKRDPFAPQALPQRSNQTEEASTPSLPMIQMSAPRSPIKLELKAVAIEAQQRSAVINRQVVYEGEMIEDYQVVSIQLKGVWVQRQGKKEWLTFAPDTTSS